MLNFQFWRNKVLLYLTENSMDLPDGIQGLFLVPSTRSCPFFIQKLKETMDSNVILQKCPIS